MEWTFLVAFEIEFRLISFQETYDPHRSMNFSIGFFLPLHNIYNS